MKHPEKLTWRFAPLAIVVTIVPIVVNLWYVLVYKACEPPSKRKSKVIEILEIIYKVVVIIKIATIFV